MKWKNKLPRVRLIAAILAGCSLAGTAFGAGIVDMIASFGTIILAMLLVVTLIAAVADLKDKRADWLALSAAVLVPVMLLAMGGAFGQFGGTLVGGINGATETAVSTLLGV